jgi:hypothetical protein
MGWIMDTKFSIDLLNLVLNLVPEGTAVITSGTAVCTQRYNVLCTCKIIKYFISGSCPILVLYIVTGLQRRPNAANGLNHCMYQGPITCTSTSSKYLDKMRSRIPKFSFTMVMQSARQQNSESTQDSRENPRILKIKYQDSEKSH